jgi:hypothetical protein
MAYPYILLTPTSNSADELTVLLIYSRKIRNIGTKMEKFCFSALPRAAAIFPPDAAIAIAIAIATVSSSATGP